MFRFTPRQIEIFLAVARARSIRKSAEILGISPASVSEQISRLEEQLRAELFVRLPGRGVKMSHAGNRLFHVAADFVASGIAMGTMFEEPRSAEVRTFIGLSIMECLVSPNLSNFLIENSDVTLKFLPTEIGYRLDEAIERQEVDCALFYCDPRHPKGQSITLEMETPFIYVNNRLTKLNSNIDLNSLSYVTINAAPGGTAQTIEILESTGIEDPKIFAEATHQRMALQLAVAYDCGVITLPFAAKIFDPEGCLVPVRRLGDWERRLYLSPRLNEDVRVRLTAFFNGIFQSPAPASV